MTKDEILKKHEDLNEYHFHQVDREFILQAMQEYADKKLALLRVINWVACKDDKPVDGKEYLISDGEDVTEAQWYDDSKWGGEPYDSYTHYAEKPKPPCL